MDCDDVDDEYEDADDGDNDWGRVETTQEDCSINVICVIIVNVVVVDIASQSSPS